MPTSSRAGNASILVVGSVALDSVKTPFGRVEDGLGGSAVYFSTAASIFSHVRLVGVVGQDFPRRHIAFLRSRDIDVRGLEIAAGNTFKWKGWYGYDLNTAHTVYTHLNVFAAFNPKIPAEYRDSEFVFLANIDPDIQLDVLRQVKRPMLIACDTMNFWIANKRARLKKVLKKVDIILLNEGEARQLTGETNLVKAGRAVLKMGPGKVILKKGEHGVIFFSNGAVFAAPAYMCETIYDPTGAGDSFGGGFMGYLASCRRITTGAIHKALVYGTIAASFTVEGFSLDKLAKVRKADLARRLREYECLTRY